MFRIKGQSDFNTFLDSNTINNTFLIAVNQKIEAAQSIVRVLLTDLRFVHTSRIMVFKFFVETSFKFYKGTSMVTFTLTFMFILSVLI